MSHKLTREEKIIMYVLNNVTKLIDKGFIPKNVWKNNIALKPVNNRDVKRVLKNFEPTEEEVMSVLETLADEYMDFSKAGKEFPRMTEA